MAIKINRYLLYLFIYCFKFEIRLIKEDKSKEFPSLLTYNIYIYIDRLILMCVCVSEHIFEHK